MQLMKKKFEEMDQKFDQVFAQFDEVKNLIQETSLKAQYGEYDHTISALSHRLEQFLTASAEAVEGQKATFITAYESSYGSATYKLWRGMMGETVLSDNILEIAIKYTENDRGRVQKMMKGVANLILQGVKIHLFYLKAKGRDATYEEEKETWEDHIIQLTDHMQEVDQKVTNAWKSQSVEDLSTKLASLNGKSNSDFADKFYDFVSKKYDWRDWNVVVYNPISGQDNHRIRACNGKHYYRTHGRNVIMGSVDQSKAAINRGIALDVFRKAKTVYTYQFIFGYHQGPWGATNVFDSLPTQFRTGCSPYAAVGVIDKDAGIQYRAPFRRLAIKTNGEYKLHAFG
ncbi:uncharacterized protein LOC117103382 [Anneissia japonica]|uniref:uncharacterized protein LOC117103382 n=1 Tax=Anneissia japonica TaxID=1529436 RepID=UPI0014255C22|nr:uncharacterized protein LOC117103382 [Anneissia japonica]